MPVLPPSGTAGAAKIGKKTGGLRLKGKVSGLLGAGTFWRNEVYERKTGN
jgi:hypothetical protein